MGEADMNLMMSNKRSFKYAWIFSLALVVLSSVLLPSSRSVVYAAVPRLENIRVALFIQTRDMTPSVTLSHPNAMYIGIRAPDGVRNWITVNNGASVRFSVDQYRVLLYETADLSAAKSVASQLSNVMNARERAFVFAVQRAGTTFYQVVAGNYMSFQEATTARDRLLAAGALASAVNGYPVQIKGPYHLSAGSFVAEYEAAAIQDLYRSAGIDAEIVYHENEAQQLVYSVWVGEESTPELLEAVKTNALTLVPDLPLVEVGASLPYLYKRTDYSGTSPIDHYFYNANVQKVWVSADTPGIKVQERSNRTYRGSMELSQYNGRLALINELPFEQYLYSVVSTEMGGGFPIEALKAQAVAARTYALQQGMKYGIAHISDTVYDQAYYGYGLEVAAAIQAVDATAGEVVVQASDYSLITPFYSSNAGGFTSETAEVWGTAVSYIHSVPSPDDIAEAGRPTWYRVVLQSGRVGYVRSDLVVVSGATSSGLTEATVLDNNTNVRPSPDTTGTPITQVHKGDRLVIIESVVETNPYSWISPMWTAKEMLARINQYVKTPITGELRSLDILERGNSGRVITIVANGSQKLDVTSPDGLRTVLNGLRSTKFDIDQTNDIAILGAQGATVNVKQLADQGPLYVLSASTAASSPQTLQQEYLIMMNRHKQVRVGTMQPEFRFVGRGYGHGLGMSQYGAKALAELGYDYARILQYYYKNVLVIKG